MLMCDKREQEVMSSSRCRLTRTLRMSSRGLAKVVVAFGDTEALHDALA